MIEIGGGRRGGVLPRFSLVVVPATIVLLACQVGGSTTEDGEEPDGSSVESVVDATERSLAGSAGAPAGSQMPDSPNDSVSLRVEAPEAVAAGEPVPITLRLHNFTERTLTLYLTGREITFDVIIERPDGTTLWRRLQGEVVQSILRLEQLQPGQTLTLEASWNQRSNEGEPLAPGEYRVRGEILTEGDPITSTAEPLRILPD